jgi:hypothetical protein
MGLFNKMYSALAMLGNIDIVKQIDETRIFDSYNIKLIVKDYITIDELLSGIEANKSCAYVLISDTALLGMENGKYQIIQDIREAYPDVVIAMFMNHEKPDEKFKNWAYGNKVYNIYYADSDGAFDFEAVVTEIQNTKNGILKFSEKEKETLRLSYEYEKQEYKRQVDAEAEEKAAENIAKYSRMMKERHARITPKQFGTVTIGVFSLSAGAGSTYTSACIGEYFAGLGYESAVIAFDGKEDLTFADGRADYFTPFVDAREKRRTLSAVLNSDYNFVILDFGNLFPIMPDGELYAGCGAGISERQEDADELLRCKYKIGVGFSSPWHINKLNWFINNDAVELSSCLFAIDGAARLKSLRHLKIRLCERDMDVINEHLSENFRITRSENKKPESVGIISKLSKKEKGAGI